MTTAVKRPEIPTEPLTMAQLKVKFEKWVISWKDVHEYPIEHFLVTNGLGDYTHPQINGEWSGFKQCAIIFGLIEDPRNLPRPK